MKKAILIAALAATLMVGGLTGCGGSSNETVNPPTVDTNASMTLADLEKNGIENGLDGLCDFLKGNGIVAEDSHYPAMKMLAKSIGAETGKKFQFILYDDKQVLIEVYEYDLKNLSDTAKETQQCVRDNGYFIVPQSDNKQANAILSPSGRYLIHNSNTGEEQADIVFREKLEELLKEYDEKEAAVKVKVDDTETSQASEAGSETETSAEESAAQ